MGVLDFAQRSFRISSIFGVRVKIQTLSDVAGLIHIFLL